MFKKIEKCVCQSVIIYRESIREDCLRKFFFSILFIRIKSNSWPFFFFLGANSLLTVYNFTNLMALLSKLIMTVWWSSFSPPWSQFNVHEIQMHPVTSKTRWSPPGRLVWVLRLRKVRCKQQNGTIRTLFIVIIMAFLSHWTKALLQ